MSSVFTLQEAADELGVHYMTAYRYVRLGLLDASKVGGVWQIDGAAIAAFRDGTAAGPVERGSSAPWSQRLETRLVEGDARGAWGVVEAAMTSGTDVRSVYLDLIGPAMVHIGARWAAGEFDVAVEHQATSIALKIIGRLSPRFAHRGRSRGGILIGCPIGEAHALPTAILSDLMRLRGWEVSDLGQNTPSVSFLDAARRMSKLDAIALSITHVDHLPGATECCSAIRQELPDVMIVVGGQAVHGDEHAVLLGADARATSDEQLHDLLVNGLPGDVAL
jgi:excisionase family DNA binding protein